MANCKASGCKQNGFLNGYCRFHYMLSSRERSGARPKSAENEKDNQIPAKEKEPPKSTRNEPDSKRDSDADVATIHNPGAGKTRKSPVRKKKKPIRKVSRKQAKINREVSKINKKQREKNPTCQICSPVCVKTPTFSHHVQGRNGANATDESKIIQACNPCNEYVESHPEFAIAHGFKISKHEPNYKREK